jgi:hypothetical protein
LRFSRERPHFAMIVTAAFLYMFIFNILGYTTIPIHIHICKPKIA